MPGGLRLVSWAGCLDTTRLEVESQASVELLTRHAAKGADPMSRFTGVGRCLRLLAGSWCRVSLYEGARRTVHLAAGPQGRGPRTRQRAPTPKTDFSEGSPLPLSLPRTKRYAVQRRGGICCTFLKNSLPHGTSFLSGRGRTCSGSSSSHHVVEAVLIPFPGQGHTVSGTDYVAKVLDVDGSYLSLQVLRTSRCVLIVLSFLRTRLLESHLNDQVSDWSFFSRCLIRARSTRFLLDGFERSSVSSDRFR